MSTDPSIRRPLCVGIGEALWDLLPTGAALGGAPVNVCAHAMQLGFRASAISAVGDDVEGRNLLLRVKELGIGTEGMQVHRGLPTGAVDVTLDTAGVPCFTIRAPAAWDAVASTPEALRLVREADAVVFGSLAQRDPRSRAAIQSLLAATRPDCLRVFDINLRPPFVDVEVIRASLERAQVLKLSDTELPVLSGLLGLAGDETARLKAIRDGFDLKWVVYTRGAQGSRMLSADEDVTGAPCAARVVDTVGAGDAFTAVVTVGLVQGWDCAKIQARANRVAAFVCSQAGAVPRLPEELARV